MTLEIMPQSKHFSTTCRYLILRHRASGEATLQLRQDISLSTYRRRNPVSLWEDQLGAGRIKLASPGIMLLGCVSMVSLVIISLNSLILNYEQLTPFYLPSLGKSPLGETPK